MQSSRLKYNKELIQLIDNESVDIPIEDRCDDYYKLWSKIYKEVLQYWDFTEIDPMEEFKNYFNTGG